MSNRLLVLVAMMTSAAVYICDNSEAVGQTTPVAFMNITPDVNELGYIQVYVVAPNNATIHLKSYTYTVGTKPVSTSLFDFYNVTQTLKQISVVKESEIGKERVDRVGQLLSSDSHIQTFGVIVDKGTTDGFLALPLTHRSTEFFIAAWNCTNSFFAAVQVVSALPDTCIEIWEVDGDSYRLQTSQYLDLSHLVHTFPANLHQDITGLLINSSKPIGVTAGHSCAFVPQDVFYCDHMIEQIPPVSELGLTHIAPPIIGRNESAGYYVRVVSTDLNTMVAWDTADGATTGSQVVTRGRFVQIYNPIASQAMRIVCDKPCLVMQYNPGRNMVGILVDKPTDPFMMLVTSVERFENKSAGFATANFFYVQLTMQSLVEFVNYAAVVTRTSDVGQIMFDGKPLPLQWTSVSNWGYSYVAFTVSHGPHIVSVADGSSALFGVYAYGHSAIDTSTSAYGYAVGFEVKGELVSSIWQQSQQGAADKMEANRSSTCAQERIYTGSAVADFPTAKNPLAMTFRISLDSTVSSPPMTADCRERYRLALFNDLVNLSRTVNYRICTGAMCPYISGAAGSGVRVVESDPRNPHVVYVAVNTAALIDPISFSVVSSTGAMTGVGVEVPYTGLMNTTAMTFAKCRVEVREFMRHYANWPRSNQLFADLTSRGCPRITVYEPYEFLIRKTVCSVP